MRNVYLIDTENVGKSFLLGLSELKKNDKVVIFVSKQSGKLSYEECLLIRNAICDIQIIECCVGTTNAMDFQIVAYLGMCVKSASKTHYHIVTNDRGFSAATRFLNSMGYKTDISLIYPGIPTTETAISEYGVINETIDSTTINRVDGVSIKIDGLLSDKTKKFISNIILDEEKIHTNFIMPKANRVGNHLENKQHIMAKINFNNKAISQIKRQIIEIALPDEIAGIEYNSMILDKLLKDKGLLLNSVFLELVAFMLYECWSLRKVYEYMNNLDMTHKASVKSAIAQNINLFMNKDPENFTTNL